MPDASCWLSNSQHSLISSPLSCNCAGTRAINLYSSHDDSIKSFTEFSIFWNMHWHQIYWLCIAPIMIAKREHIQIPVTNHQLLNSQHSLVPSPLLCRCKGNRAYILLLLTGWQDWIIYGVWQLQKYASALCFSIVHRSHHDSSKITYSNSSHKILIVN